MSMVAADFPDSLADPNPKSLISLPSAFRKAQSLYTDLDSSSLSTNSPEYQSKLSSALSLFLQCHTAINNLALFSPNEILDDINTSDLPYLCVNAYIAMLSQNRISDPFDRWNVVQQAKMFYHSFLDNVDRYGMLAKEDKLYLQSRINKSSDKLSPAEQRANKIKRYKESKSINAKLAELHKHLEHFRSTGSSNSTSLFTSSEDNTKDLIAELDEEETERDWTLALIQSLVLKTLDELVSIYEELPFLEKMKEMKENEKNNTLASEMQKEQERRRESDDHRSLRLDKLPDEMWSRNGPLLSKEGKPLRPFIIAGSHVQARKIQENVFKPSHRLPTMTIDEYLEEERKMGNILEGGGKQSETKSKDDMDEDATDQETYKSRKWDEFKDDNPRGWGNRLNKG